MFANPPDPSAEDSHKTKGLIRLTMACNERCPFCNVPMEDYDELTPSDDIIQQQLDAFIAAGDQTLTISGGEPTLLRRRLLSLAARASSGGISFIEVQTNAVLIDDNYARALQDAGVTSAFVSLLSHVPELHDELAGLEGAFEKCVRGIRALTDAGIRVALNPVTARTTQHLIEDYITFVANHLPGVTSISLSAVQPHGRARHNLELMPDYETLKAHVIDAQASARRHGIELLNPYCGLPLCIGWSKAMSQSVEAIEAQVNHTAQGLQNSGNKRQGEPCTDCGLRTRCGGAWHAYWDHREGSGIRAPWMTPLPWEAAIDDRVKVSDGRETLVNLGEVAPSSAITHWLWVQSLAGFKFGEVLEAGVTHVAIESPLDALKPLLAKIRRWSHANTLLPPQRQIQFHLRLGDDFSTVGAQQAADLIQLFAAVGIARVHTRTEGPHDSRLRMSGLVRPVAP